MSVDVDRLTGDVRTVKREVVAAVAHVYGVEQALRTHEGHLRELESRIGSRVFDPDVVRRIGSCAELIHKLQFQRADAVISITEARQHAADLAMELERSIQGVRTTENLFRLLFLREQLNKVMSDMALELGAKHGSIRAGFGKRGVQNECSGHVAVVESNISSAVGGVTGLDTCGGC